jgi:hypothetical protein
MTPVDYRAMEKYGIKNDPVFSYVEAPPPYPPPVDQCIIDEPLDSREDQTVLVEKDGVETPETCGTDKDNIVEVDLSTVPLFTYVHMGSPLGDQFIPDPLDAHVDQTVVAFEKCEDQIDETDEEVLSDVGNVNIDMDDNVENDPPVVETSDIDMDQLDKTKPSVNTTDKTDGENSKRVPCSLCFKTFKYKKNLKYHEEHHHADQASAGVVAMKEREKAARAKYTPKPKTRVKCDECDQTLSCNQDLEGHKMWKHGDPNDPKVIAFKLANGKKKRKLH